MYNTFKRLDSRAVRGHVGNPRRMRPNGMAKMPSRIPKGTLQMSKNLVAIALAFVGWPMLALGDVFILKNRSTLTGSTLWKTRDSYVIRTKSGEKREIPIANVKEVVSDQEYARRVQEQHRQQRLEKIAADRTLGFGMVPLLVRRLYSQDAAERAQAACDLGERGESAKAAVPYLADLLSDTAELQKGTSMVLPFGGLLAEAKAKEQAKSMAEMGMGMRTSPGNEAALALARIDQSGVQALLDTLKGGGSSARLNALDGVRSLMVDPLRLAERDLTNLTPERRRLVQDSAKVNDTRRQRVLGSLKKDAVLDAVRCALKDKDAAVQVEAVRLLGGMGDFDSLLPILRDGTPDMRSAAVTALSVIRDDRVVEPIRAALKDKDEQVRCAAANAIGIRKDIAAIDALIGMLGNDREAARVAAAGALGKLGQPRAGPALQAALKGPLWRVRAQAASSLGALKYQDAVTALISCLKDKQGEVRRAASAALAAMGEPGLKGVE
jgi:HEAT repeat protein